MTRTTGRIRRLGTDGYRCWCIDLGQPISPYLVTQMAVRVKPGTWHAHLLPGSDEYACRCKNRCEPAPALHGGRILDPPPQL